MDIKLSVCIPTFNRADYIGQCLESVVPQMGPGMEVVIVDGGSTDRTAEVVQEYQSRFPFIRFFRREHNVGVDDDILKVVDLATGTFCWLLSDDDCLLPGSVQHVLQKLESQEGLAGASLNYEAYDKTMSFRIRAVPPAGHDALHEDFLFDNRDRCFSVLGIHFGFLSAQVVRRTLWQEVVLEDDLTPYKGSCWMLVYVLGRVLQKNPRWLYIHRPSLQLRTGNDSFKARVGVYNRQLIAHVSYPAVINQLFGEGSSVCRNILTVLVSDRMPRTLAQIKAEDASFRLQFQLLALYTPRYWSFPTYWWKVVPLFLVPCFVFRLVRFVYMSRREGADSRAGATLGRRGNGGL